MRRPAALQCWAESCDGQLAGAAAPGTAPAGPGFGASIPLELPAWLGALSSLSRLRLKAQTLLTVRESARAPPAPGCSRRRAPQARARPSLLHPPSAAAAAPPQASDAAPRLAPLAASLQHLGIVLGYGHIDDAFPHGLPPLRRLTSLELSRTALLDDSIPWVGWGGGDRVWDKASWLLRCSNHLLRPPAATRAPHSLCTRVRSPQALAQPGSWRGGRGCRVCVAWACHCGGQVCAAGGCGWGTPRPSPSPLLRQASGKSAAARAAAAPAAPTAAPSPCISPTRAAREAAAAQPPRHGRGGRLNSRGGRARALLVVQLATDQLV